MIQYAETRVQDMFAAISLDWTPASLGDAVSVLYAPASADPRVTALCASVLSESELERADRFLVEESRVQFIQRRAFRRYCGALALGDSRPLSRVSFSETAKGRPYLPGAPDVFFSFSSCRLGFLGAWSAARGVGVDVEDPTRPIEAAELAARYFSTAEAAAVESADANTQLQTFFQLWSLKEAALKSIGEGLPFGLDTFEFVPGRETSIVDAPRDHGGARQFQAYLIGSEPVCAALVIQSRV